MIYNHAGVDSYAVWLKYQQLKTTSCHFSTMDGFVRLVDEAYAKQDFAACLALGLFYLEARAGRSLAKAVLPRETGGLTHANTWASGYWGPVTKMIQTEQRDVETGEAYGLALVHMVRSFMQLKRSAVCVANDRAFRAELTTLKALAVRIEQSFTFSLEFCGDDLYRKILLESGCLEPMLKGERLDLDALYGSVASQREALVAHYGEDAAVRFDADKQEVTGEPIEQEKTEHDLYEHTAMAAAATDEELPAPGETVVLDWGHLGSGELETDHPAGGGDAAEDPSRPG
jgi:hypothetical protein